MVTRRLISKISKGLPFPPATRNHQEDDFDFEKILDSNRALDAQLTPAQHSNELLEAELSKEADLLESERVMLMELENNAKTEASKRKQDGKKLHSLLQSEDPLFKEEIKDHVGLKLEHSTLPLNLKVGFRSFLKSLTLTHRLEPQGRKSYWNFR
jgi:hypothetical protein